MNRLPFRGTFEWVSFCISLVFCVVFCQPLFNIFLFAIVLTFTLRLLITSLVSSNVSRWSNSPQVTCHSNQTQYADFAQCSLWSYSLFMQAYLRSSRKDQLYSLWLDHTAIYSTRGEHANNYTTDVVETFMRLLVLFLLYSRAIVDLQLSNYLRNQSLSPLKLCVRIPLMARSTPYNILWKSLLVTCSRSVVSSCFLYQ